MQLHGKSEIEPILEILRARAGLSFSSRRIEHVESGIGRAMKKIGVSDLAAYRKLAASGSEVLEDLIDELTVGETYFFRDPDQFEFIRQTILPDLLRRRGPAHQPRVWSAGCASGEEAYTLAMVLTEEGFLGRSYVLGTDISRRALAKAHKAVYTEWSLRQSRSNGYLSRYLRSDGKTFFLDSALRAKVSFKSHNLALNTYPSLTAEIWGMDLILCRNVLIYFDQDTIRSVARRLFASLSDGGWLLTGPSDPLLDKHAPWEAIATRQGVFYRRNAGGLVAELPKTEPIRADRAQVAQAEVEPPRPALPTTLLRSEPQLGKGREDRGGATGTSPDRQPGTAPRPEIVAQARAALAAGEYARVAELREALCRTAAGCAVWVRALANLEGSGVAEQAVSSTLARHPLSSELHLLRTVFLTDLGRNDEALEAVHRTLYLDPSLAIAHFFAGAIHLRRGDPAGARRAYRNALGLSMALAPESELPLADGEHAGRLADAAQAQLGMLDGPREDSP